MGGALGLYSDGQWGALVKPSGQGTVLVEDLVRCVGVGASVRENIMDYQPCKKWTGRFPWQSNS